MKAVSILGIASLVAVTLTMADAQPPAQVQLIPIKAEVTNGVVKVPPTNPQTLEKLPPLPAGHLVSVKLDLVDKIVEITPGMRYKAWTFNGVVPGPVIHARVGDTIDVTLTSSRAAMGHSIDFHAALAPPNIAYQTVQPGHTLRFRWVASSPGAFLYHCGTPPVLAHISNGMYGAIIIDPPGGWGADAQSFVFVQSEFYPIKVPGGPWDLYQGSLKRMEAASADVVAFNGDGFRYLTNPLTISVNKLVRVFVVNAGPSHFSAFHVIGTLFQHAYADGNPANAQVGIQTLNIPPGGGAMAEFTLLQAGRYPFVTHAFGDADHGAMGAFIAK